MSLKLKVVLGILCLIAIILVSRVVAVIGRGITTASIGQQITVASGNQVALAIGDDPDHDGLSGVGESRYNTDPTRADTDGDGYLDGEEVVSGCNPKKAAPDDCSARTANVTKNIFRLVLGALQAGDLQSPTDDQSIAKNLDTLTTTALDAINQKFSQPPAKTLASLDAGTQDTPLYLVRVNENLKGSLLEPKQTLKDDLTQALTGVLAHPDQPNPALTKLQENFMASYEGMRAISAPATWQTWHTQMTSTLYTLAQAFALVGNSNDPLTQSVSISKLTTALGTSATLLKEAAPAMTRIHAAIIPGMPNIPGLPGGGIPGLPGTGDAQGLECSIEECVPVHVKQDDPFQTKWEADVEQRKIAAQALQELMKVYQDAIEKGVDVKGNSSPTFIADWRYLAQSSQDRGANDIGRSEVANTLSGTAENPDSATACPYLADAVGAALNAQQPPTDDAAAAIPGYRIDSDTQFKVANQCTLPDDFDVSAYLDESGFNADTFTALLEPQNNFYGLYANGYEEIERQRAAEEKINQNEVQANGGSRGHRNAEGQIDVPGSVFSDTNSNLWKTNLEWIISSDASRPVNPAGTGGIGIPGLPGIGGCGANSFPEQLLNIFLKQFTTFGLCDFLKNIGNIIKIIDQFP